MSLIAYKLLVSLGVCSFTLVRVTYIHSFERKLLKFCEEPATLSEIIVELNKNVPRLRRLTKFDVYILLQNLAYQGYIEFITYYYTDEPTELLLLRHLIYPSCYITRKDKPPKKRKYKKPKVVHTLKGVFAPSLS